MTTPACMTRHAFDSDGVRLSYLDTGQTGAPFIVALHALWMQAGTFGDLAARLFPDWRVVALDQRGHGHSGRADDYSRDAFVADIGRLLDHLQVREPAVLLGNSLGGTNAFQFAARQPQRVSHLIVAESPVHEAGDMDWLDDWRGTFADRAAFARVAGKFFASLAPSLIDVPGGVRLRFEIDDIQATLRQLQGDWWADWLGSHCPALVLYGTQSRAVPAADMRAMAARRPNTAIAALDAGHVVHEDALMATHAAITQFLRPESAAAH